MPVCFGERVQGRVRLGLVVDVDVLRPVGPVDDLLGVGLVRDRHLALVLSFVPLSMPHAARPRCRRRRCGPCTSTPTTGQAAEQRRARSRWSCASPCRPGVDAVSVMAAVPLVLVELFSGRRRSFGASPCGRRGDVVHDVLDLRVLLEGVRGSCPCRSRSLVAPVRHLADDRDVVVDPDAARLDLPGGAQGTDRRRASRRRRRARTGCRWRAPAPRRRCRTGARRAPDRRPRAGRSRCPARASTTSVGS